MINYISLDISLIHGYEHIKLPFVLNLVYFVRMIRKQVNK
jgi:hypothetical protein